MTSNFLDRVGSAPISWGICEAPGWGAQLPIDRVLSEARDLGLTDFEQGALGWLPTDPVQLRALLAEYDLRLLGGFVPLVLHEPERSAAELAQAEVVAANMKAGGGRFFVSAMVGSAEEWFRPEMDGRAWSEVFANLSRLDDICAAAGLTQAVHPHVDTLIETADEFQRFLDSCDAKCCLDTGHLTIGGADVVALAKGNVDRVGLVHVKDIDGDAMARKRSGDLDLMAATQAGLFPPIGDGIVPIAETIEVLEAGGYRGWYVVETDVALTDGEPPVGEGPVLGVARSLEYLRSLPIAVAAD